MKKAKIISIVVIMLSVIALGVFMGKQMFKLMEAGSTQSAPTTAATDGTEDQSSVKVLYSGKASESAAEKVVEITEAVSQEVANSESIQMATTSGQAAQESPRVTEPAFDQNGPKWFAYAVGNGTNVRSGPSTKDKMLFKVSKGTRGVVTEKKDGWTNIKWDFNRKSGWVRDDLLIQGPAAVMTSLVSKTDDAGKIDPEQISKAAVKEAIRETRVAVAIARPAPASETVTTYVQGQPLPEQAIIEATTFANIRSKPTTTSEKLGKLPKGMVVQIKSTQKEGKWRWFEIIYNEGRKTGWTREDNLKF